MNAVVLESQELNHTADGEVVLAGGIVTPAGGFEVDVFGSGLLVYDGLGDDTIYAAAGGFDVTVGGSGSLTFVGSAAPTSLSISKPYTSGYLTTVFGGSGGGNFTDSAGAANVMVSQGASGTSTTPTGAITGDILFGSAAGTDILTLKPDGGTVVGGGGPTTMNGDAIFGGTGSVTVNGSEVYNSTPPATPTDTVVGGAGSFDYVANGANVLAVGGAGKSII